MPMTTRQLQQVALDYADFLPVPGKVVACEEARPGENSTCDICGKPFWQRKYYRSSAKQLVIVVADQMIRHYRLLVCRQGVTCRLVRAQEITYAQAVKHLDECSISTVEPHVVPYAKAAS